MMSFRLCLARAVFQVSPGILYPFPVSTDRKTLISPERERVQVMWETCPFHSVWLPAWVNLSDQLSWCEPVFSRNPYPCCRPSRADIQSRARPMSTEHV